MKKVLLALAVAIALAGGVRAGDDDGDKQPSDRFEFKSGTLVLSRSKYVGTASSVTVGQTLPPGCVPVTVTLPILGSTKTTSVKVTCGSATYDGTFPSVFNNDASDGSFGITSPIFLDNITTDGWLLGTLPIPSDQIVTSFSSKSELALNRSTDGKSLTFIGYRGGPGFLTAPNLLDVSATNTPGVIDPTNPAVGQYYRSVAEVDAHGHLQITEGNAYSGDNGRAAIKANSVYYMVGNDNSGGLSKTQLPETQVGVNLINDTGAELLYPGQTPPVPPDVNKIGTFSITQEGYPADKAGKDNNFRGTTVFNNTLYVVKGSGGNGINTVYQVGDAGTLPTGTTAALAAMPITILPGFPTTLASATATALYPFGIWFANADTLYVCDEGDGNLVTPAVNGNVADAWAQTTAGVQKWSLVNGTWHMDYVLQKGLNIGIPYSVANYPTAINPATGGCRNITGRVHHDGTATIYAVTSTISASGDAGADPNKLVKITDVLSATTLPTGEEFVTIRAPKAGEVLRGVAFAPEDRGHDDHDGDGGR